ncbi:MAG: 2-oxo acid dehydrogenase subunit E2, partial [Deltaproteobacteria bacterium]
MAIFEVVMPKLGESIIEATITKWLLQEGDTVAEDDPIVEIATDKVDSEIPSPVEGKITKVHFAEGDVVAVGAIIALIDMDGEADSDSTEKQDLQEPQQAAVVEQVVVIDAANDIPEAKAVDFSSSDRFYSPLVKSIASKENVSVDELNTISGSGKDSRVTKKDILQYIDDKKAGKVSTTPSSSPPTPTGKIVEQATVTAGI